MYNIVMQSSIVSALIAFVLGLAGWKIAKFLRLPAPAMLGPMILVGGAVLLGLPSSDIPLFLSISVQSIIGGFIGRRIDRTALKSAGSMLPGIFVMTIWYIAGTAFIGLIVARVAHVDTGTAFLGMAPGGVAEMTALAITTQADVAFVATLQASRVIASNVLIPLIVKRSKASRVKQQDLVSSQTEEAPMSWIIGLIISLVGGFAFALLKFPAGGIIGSMLFVAISRNTGLRFGVAPKCMLVCSYIVLGISVGFSFDSNTVGQIGSSLTILIAATFFTIASGLALGFVVRRLMHIDMRTALLACSPGGLSLMAVVAEETGANSVLVSFFHLVRIVLIILTMPLFLRLALMFR
ncbi:hypothetical protein MASR2M78_12750 [Treponema sp.]